MKSSPFFFSVSFASDHSSRNSKGKKLLICKRTGKHPKNHHKALHTLNLPGNSTSHEVAVHLNKSQNLLVLQFDIQTSHSIKLKDLAPNFCLKFSSCKHRPLQCRFFSQWREPSSNTRCTVVLYCLTHSTQGRAQCWELQGVLLTTQVFTRNIELGY